MIRVRTTKAREMQKQRYGNKYLNSTAPVQLILEACSLNDSQNRRIKEVCYEQKWSNRTQIKILRIARTIADLQCNEAIEDIHLQEAIEWKMETIHEAVEGVHHG